MPKPGSEGHGKSGHLSDPLRRKAPRRYFTFSPSYPDKMSGITEKMTGITDKMTGITDKMAGITDKMTGKTFVSGDI